MIEDWVYCFDPEEPEDRQINKVSAVRVEYNEGAIKFEQFTDWFEEGWFAPIPLTPEILEWNGFWWGLPTDIEDLMSMGVGVPVTADKSWVWEDENGGVVTLVFPNETDGGELSCRNEPKSAYYGWLDSIYVHELQHCLRLCGLNDLADNFKV